MGEGVRGSGLAPCVQAGRRCRARLQRLVASESRPHDQRGYRGKPLTDRFHLALTSWACMYTCM